MPTVVAGFDASSSSHDAVKLAAHVAAVLDATLVVAFVFRQNRMDELDTAEWREFVRGVAERELEEVRHIAGEGELVPVGAESPPRGLQQLAADRDAAVIFVGSTHRGPLGRIVPGAVGQRLLAEAPCPVGVVPRGWDVEGAWPASVVIGYDATPESELALMLGRRIAEARGLRPYVLTADASDPAEAIVAAAREDGLILVGSRGHTPVEAAIRDSVSADVLRQAPCPVLVTPRSLTEVG